MRTSSACSASKGLNRNFRFGYTWALWRWRSGRTRRRGRLSSRRTFTLWTRSWRFSGGGRTIGSTACWRSTTFFGCGRCSSHRAWCRCRFSRCQRGFRLLTASGRRERSAGLTRRRRRSFWEIFSSLTFFRTLSSRFFRATSRSLATRRA